MHKIINLLFTVDHIRVNARNRKKIERIIKQQENKSEWTYLLIPLTVLLVAIIGLWLAL